MAADPSAPPTGVPAPERARAIALLKDIEAEERASARQCELDAIEAHDYSTTTDRARFLERASAVREAINALSAAGAGVPPEPKHERAAWGGITEAEAKRIAAEVVQRLSDSEPSADTIEAQERLAGTPQESMFCLNPEDIERAVEIAISDATYDAPHYAAGVPPEQPTPTLEEFRELTSHLTENARLLGVSEAGHQTWLTARQHDVNDSRSRLESLFTRLQSALSAAQQEIATLRAASPAVSGPAKMEGACIGCGHTRYLHSSGVGQCAGTTHVRCQCPAFLPAAGAVSGPAPTAPEAIEKAMDAYDAAVEFAHLNPGITKNTAPASARARVLALVEQLREDARRLDFVERGWTVYYDGEGWWFMQDGNGDPHGRGRAARDAIDAARTQEESPK